jgi:ATPase subunit of ABC transporter with duplicated ATPase domains
MLLSVDIQEKTIGSKLLFQNLSLSINDGEKIGMIGRNGVGKTSLLKMIVGQDNDYDGEITLRKHATIIMTAQEHMDFSQQSCLEYILSELPDYERLHHIIETYPSHMGSDPTKIHNYTEALETFNEHGYFRIEERVLRALNDYQIDERLAKGPFKNLSGGQKRFVELVKVQESAATMALIDEPTNHMDYLSKDAFIEWMKTSKSTLLIITHDRDVLAKVDRIIELKDRQAHNYKSCRRLKNHHFG